jgi:hypothetical protein
MVQTEGRDSSLIFECRIGSTLDVPELLAAQEVRLEENMWTVHTALHESIALLEDLEARGRDHGESPETIRAYRERAARPRADAIAVRRVIDASRQ